MDQIAAEHYEKYISRIKEIEKKKLPEDTMKCSPPTNVALLNDQLIYNFYGREFSRSCFRALKDNVKCDLEFDDVISDDESKIETSEPGNMMKVFDNFVAGLCERHNRVGVMSSDESELSIDSDYDYYDDSNKYYAKKMEHLSKLIKVTASLNFDQYYPPRNLNIDFQNTPYDREKPAPLDDMISKADKALERVRLRRQRADIRKERELRRRKRLFLTHEKTPEESSVRMDVAVPSISSSSHLLCVSAEEDIESKGKASNKIAQKYKKGRARRKKRGGSSDDDDDFTQLEALADRKMKQRSHLF
ncbi:uncharacterized protein LOC112126619 isoform X2 [Cimex lectularius]|nr:uncharacterized protein LOC112126619 isoform X2 [Cimex lectularius]